MGTLGINEMKTDAKSSGAGQNYGTAVVRMSEIEEDIGLSLAKNSQLTGLAAKIQRYSGVGSYESLYEDEDLSLERKIKVDKDVGTIGGALSFQQGWGTLGGSVNAVMNQIESTGTSKSEYSISLAAGHPYFPKEAKKPEFDKRIPKEEENAPKYVKSNPNANITARKLLDQVCHQYVNQSQLVNALEGLDSTRPAAIEATRELMKSNVDMNGMIGALLDITLDKHSSGDDANYVAKDENPTLGKLDKNNWIDDTVLAAKPIISGPSGHTLRYLNFWKEKRDAGKDSRNIEGWPSLEAARLVMMADLMPPKHHSYDEIMTSSIGIQDKVMTVPLRYMHKSSYLDLATQQEPDARDIALKAYTESRADQIETNLALDNELLNNRTRNSVLKNFGKQNELVKAAIDSLKQIKSAPENALLNFEPIIGALEKEQVKLATSSS